MTSERCIVPKRDWNSASRTPRSSPCAPRMVVKSLEREKSHKTRKRRNPMVSSTVWGSDTKPGSAIPRDSQPSRFCACVSESAVKVHYDTYIFCKMRVLRVVSRRLCQYDENKSRNFYCGLPGCGGPVTSSKARSSAPGTRPSRETRSS